MAIFAEKSTCGKLDSSNGTCQILDGYFRLKKSARGKLDSSLSNPRMAIFIKKEACGKLDSSNGACQIQGWPFSPQKSPCENSTKQHRACQVPAKVVVRSQNIKFGPKWAQIRPFGLKIGPNESHGQSGTIWTGPGGKNPPCEPLQWNCGTLISNCHMRGCQIALLRFCHGYTPWFRWQPPKGCIHL